MKRDAPGPAALGPTPAPAAGPSEEHAALALREAVTLMAPVARWLLRNGVSYSAFADLLKAVFVDTARTELERTGAGTTQSALSVLSGVHRKDVRALAATPRAAGAPPQAARSVPLASQVFTRWLTDRRLRTRDGKPKKLPRGGSGVSFERLSRELSNDVHPRTVLDELLRLGLVRLDGDDVIPVNTGFVPSRKLDELTALFSANAADHLAAAVHNLTGGAPRFLEQSVFADWLSADSVEHLHACARAAWSQAFATMVAEASERVKGDGALEPKDQHRVRFGTYFYSEPTGGDSPAVPAATRPHKPRTRRKT